MKRLIDLKYIAVVFAIIFILLTCYLAANSGDNKRLVNSDSFSKTIIIDAGHGGFDGGAVAKDGTVEKDINLNISNTLCSMLKLCGFDVIMTRTTDTGTEDNESSSIGQRKISDLHNRLKIINNYENAVFVSIHLNKFTTSAANGAQVFYSKNHENSKFLGDKIQKSIVALLQPGNNRVIKQGTKSTFLLHNAKIPAVIVECGFISNAAELEKLKKLPYQQQMAFAVFCGILNYNGIG